MQVHGLQKVKYKILRLLWEMAPAAESSGARVVPHSQTDLAKALGVNRKTIARNLQELEDEGVIRRSGTAVEILLPREALPLRPFTAGAPNAAWIVRIGASARGGDTRGMTTSLQLDPCRPRVFAIIAGIAAFGASGLLLGPLIVTFALTLLRIYRRDFKGGDAPPPVAGTAARPPGLVAP